MKQYFSRITADHWCAKNNLEKAAHKLAKEMDRRIVPDWQVKAYKEEFKTKIQKLNEEFPRCKPLRFSIGPSPSNNGDIVIWCDGVFNMSLFLAKD
jgi:hypothetical protein